MADHVTLLSNHLHFVLSKQHSRPHFESRSWLPAFIWTLNWNATLNQSNCNDINSVKNPPMIHSFAYIRWLVQGSVEACRWRISRWNLSWEGVACKHSSLIQSRWIINFWGISPWPSSLARFGDPVFTTLGCRHEISKWIPKMAVGSCHDLRLMECLKQCRQVPPGGLGVTFKTLEYYVTKTIGGLNTTWPVAVHDIGEWLVTWLILRIVISHKMPHFKSQGRLIEISKNNFRVSNYANYAIQFKYQVNSWIPENGP